ncbi:major capsid protein [Tortoise microvirus 91]|nr:major capsid protein [Tortoise microvirus 91]
MAKNIFNSIQLTKPKSNYFDLSHDVKLSMNMGELVPILAMETVPGDKFNISAEALTRFAPMVAPPMHRMDATIHYFFVPNRLLWSDWENWIMNKPGAFTPPWFHSMDGQYTPLMDYMGIPDPTGMPSIETISALPFAAYQMIYNEYYRDQNLIEEVPYQLGNGQALNVTALTTLRRRAWEHDYFTSALPFPQKGAAVEIPMGDVTLKENWDDEGLIPRFTNEDGFTGDGAVTSNSATQDITIPSEPGKQAAYDPNGSLSVQSTSINELRRAFRLQEWLERNARAGTRYVEGILAHFGIRSSDARLQRPEYITGVKAPVTISEVLNTSGSDDLPQGNMAGHGIAVVNGKKGYYRCEEHGMIIGIMSVMPKTAYQQGIPKMFLKTTDPFEYYWPSFANIGEQPVLRKEIFAYTDTSDSTFGYVPRYADYKYMPSRVAGDFRTTLDYWHLGRKFATPPSLNKTFIECNPSHRIFAVEDPAFQKLYCHVYNKIGAVRPMPKFGTPTI